MGYLDDALFLYHRTLRGYECVNGKSHLSTLTCTHNIAALKYRLGDLQAASQMYRTSVTGFENQLGKMHAMTLSSKNNLAMVLRRQGLAQEAQELYMQALDGRAELLGPDHPDTMTTMNNLGALMIDQNRFNDALELFTKALDGQLRLLGPNHPSSLSTLTNIACLHCKLHNFDQAQELFERILMGRETSLSLHHLETLSTCHNLASVLYSKGDYCRAEKLYERAMIGRERALRAKGDNKPLGTLPLEYLSTVNNLAATLFSQNRLSEARSKYIQALKGRKNLLDQNHPDYLNTLYNLALVLQKQGDAESNKLFIKAFRGYLKKFGPSHNLTVTCKKAMMTREESQEYLGNIIKDLEREQEEELERIVKIEQGECNENDVVYNRLRQWY